MTSTDALTPPWSVLDVFGREFDVHNCCACVAGLGDLHAGLHGLPWGLTLYRARREDRSYLTDRVLAIRDDLVNCHPDDVSQRTPTIAKPIPETIPGPATGWFRPRIVRRLTHMGVTIRHSDDPNAQHLYLGTEHIGWLAGLNGQMDPLWHPTMTLGDIDIIRAIASGTAKEARRGNMDQWDDAALTLAQVRYWRTKGDAWVSDPGLCGGKAPNGGMP